MDDEQTSEDGQKLVLDFSEFAAAMETRDAALITKIVEALRPTVETSAQGIGRVEAYEDSKTKVVESLQKVKQSNWKLQEAWTVTIPLYHQAELRAGLRDHVWTTTINQGVQGDVARIPYVKDFDFELLAAVGGAITSETTGIIASLTTTLYEGAAWTDVQYHLIERFDANLLDQLNACFARAAVRSEDAQIMSLINAGTSTNFANVGEGGAARTGTVGRPTGPASFYAANIPQALGKLIAMGKDARPGECVLYITGRPYAALLQELAISQVIAYAVPSIITQGEVEKYLGITILVGGYRPWYEDRLAAGSTAYTGTVEMAYLMRGRRAVALAPKRDILIETDKQIDTRELRVTGSHTFGIEIIEYKEIVQIWTSQLY